MCFMREHSKQHLGRLYERAETWGSEARLHTTREQRHEATSSRLCLMREHSKAWGFEARLYERAET